MEKGKFLYGLAGVVLAIPYVFLAGWNIAHYLIFIVLIPGFIIAWFALAMLAGIIDNHGQRRAIRFNWQVAFGKGIGRHHSGRLTYFWIWTIYICSPIILHWSAVLLKEIGYEAVGSFIDMHRYACLILIPFMVALLISLTGIVTSMCKAEKKI